MRRLLNIQPQTHANLNPGAKYFVDGIHALGLDLPPNDSGVVDANIHDCLGCGYCNIGCAYGQKLSMLDTVLPWTQRDFNIGGRRALRILASCEAERFHSRGEDARRASSAGLRDGRRLDVRANTFVVSAGAVCVQLPAAAQIGHRRRPGGKRLAFNMGSPITADFRRSLNSYDGLQISHYLRPSPDEGFVARDLVQPGRSRRR